jgi:transcriptional regulator
MYVPAHFHQTDQDKLCEFIQQHSFALLVSRLHEEPFATHLPLLLDRSAGPSGSLVGHFARANPQWQATDRNVLAVFSGPHAYISPTWYEAEHVVPTWNYLAVHVYGTLRLVESHEETVGIVKRLVKFYEQSQPRPWDFDEAEPYFDKMAGAVVAFQIDIARLEGKWKLSQNHPRERRENVVRELESRTDENSQEIARLMAETLHGEKSP